METIENTGPVDVTMEEQIDTLIAISVVAKRLAARLRKEKEEQNERSNHDT